jgi:phosphopantothenoylcysteine decarboxylase/phosphopantothenate--cysteine ligase
MMEGIVEGSVIWPDLKGTRVLLGVSGGIAAYKTAELCRMLVRCGARVRVMMTAAARRFVGEITFAALSGGPVATDLFDVTQEAQIGHIGLADSTQLMVLAPATADLMARMACGMADDIVATVYLAYTGRVLVAPAMNVHMWQHPATQHNVALLRERGCRFVGPSEGEMACGHIGAGRMAEPEEILQAAGACLAPQDLSGRKVLVTAGPTHEAVDPVRFVGNRSSGKMGFAIAAEAAGRGASVTLVAGPTSLPTPYAVTRVDVTTARQMASAVQARAAEQTVIFMAAAVADYRPAEASETKLKKETLGDAPSLPLTRNDDILAGLAAMTPRPLLVGFAAETGGDLDRVAPVKRAAKGCDLLVANDVTAQGAGFEVDTNRVTIYDAAGHREALPLLAKRKVAEQLVDRVVRVLAAR